MTSLRKSAKIAAVLVPILCGPLAVLLMGQTQPGLFLPNTFCGGAASSSGTPTAVLCAIRTLVGADLPNPTGSSLGGVEQFTPTTHQFLTGISAAGTPTGAQPNYTDLAGVLPNPSPTTLGGIESFAAVTHQWINQISTSGTPTATQPATGDLANVAADTYLGNATAGSAAPGAVAFINCTGVGNALGYNTSTHALTCATDAVPQQTTLTSGSGTFTSPVNVLLLEVELCGPGGGGAGSGTGAPGTGATSTATTFGTALLTGNAGAGAVPASGNAAGGTATGGDLNFTGQTGGPFYASASAVLAHPGWPGGNSAFISGAGQGVSGAAGLNATTNSGGGGAGGGGSATAGVSSQGGGGGGGCLRKLITSPLASYAYAVGPTAAAGGAGTNGFAGGIGAAGYIRIMARFQ